MCRWRKHQGPADPLADPQDASADALDHFFAQEQLEQECGMGVDGTPLAGRWVRTLPTYGV